MTEAKERRRLPATGQDSEKEKQASFIGRFLRFLFLSSGMLLADQRCSSEEEKEEVDEDGEGPKRGFSSLEEQER